MVLVGHVWHPTPPTLAIDPRRAPLGLGGGLRLVGGVPGGHTAPRVDSTPKWLVMMLKACEIAPAQLNCGGHNRTRYASLDFIGCGPFEIEDRRSAPNMLPCG